MTLISTLHCFRLLRPLAVLVAAGSLACTIDKDLATASDGDPSTGTTADDPTATGEPTTTDITDPTGTSGESTGEPALGCPDHAMVDDCCCFIKSESGTSLQTVCPTEPQLCERVDLACPPEGDCEDVNDEAFVDCALMALKGQTAGEVVVHILIDDDTQRDINYHIVGDGSVYRIDGNRFDFMGTIDTGHFTLQAPDFFDACLAGTLTEKAGCLVEAVSGAADEICVPQILFDDV